MLRHWDLHENYQHTLRLKLLLHFSTQKSRISKLDKSISKLYLLNLDSLLPVIKPLYADFGRPAKNQQGIIRSFALMLDRQNYSITNWAGEAASDPLYFDLCGFEGAAPSVASYYDFLVRLWQGSQQLHVSRILGDVNAFSFAGDGSPYYSGASHYGVKTCSCRSKGIFNCSCPRRFSDPDAKWGWDSYREQWFFGSTLYGITASDSPYDLPIYLKNVQASRHDGISTIFALECYRHNKNVHFREAQGSTGTVLLLPFPFKLCAITIVIFKY